MVVSRLMKRFTRNKQRQPNYGSSSATTTSLPKDLLLEIVARVASDSITDLFNLKISCKDFLDAAEDDYIYQQVSLDKFPLIQWPPNKEKSSFLNRCRESGNLENLYREGMLQFFYHMESKTKGFESLQKAAQQGHKVAKYVVGMVLLCSEEDEELRKQGLQRLRFLSISKNIILCVGIMSKVVCRRCG